MRALLGSQIKWRATFALAPTTVTAAVTGPTGTSSLTPTVVDSTTFDVIYTPPTVGRFTVRFVGAGAAIGAGEDTVDVYSRI